MAVKTRPAVAVPAPTGHVATPMDARHYVYSVNRGGQTIIFERKDTEMFGVRIRVVDESIISPRLLLEDRGRQAIAMGLHCGGRLDSTGVWFGEPADQEAARWAIPHIYAGCSAHRRTLTALYRHLVQRAETAGER